MLDQHKGLDGKKRKDGRGLCKEGWGEENAQPRRGSRRPVFEDEGGGSVEQDVNGT